jgi:hypothetical protein
MTAGVHGAPAAFRAEYGAHRAAEGRGYRGEQPLALPHLAAAPRAPSRFDLWEGQAS